MIELQQVSKVFVNEETGHAVQALQDITLSVEDNEFVCVLGPSGCGKSTLLNLVAGFERPSAGRVLFDSRPVRQAGPDRGVVFQESALLPWLTVQQNVDFGLRNLGYTREEREERVRRFVSLVGLSDFRRARTHQLSGGMKQRVQIARVLALSPRALLMDEPFGALDAQTRDRLQDELLDVWAMERKTVLFVTHNVEEAVYLADRVVVLAPAPDGIVADVPVSFPRPRDRFSDDMREATMALLRVLANLPCCVLPSSRAGASPVVTPQKGGERYE
jgi:NitT/TauT family transport system ATP-binding protein